MDGVSERASRKLEDYLWAVRLGKARKVRRIRNEARNDPELARVILQCDEDLVSHEPDLELLGHKARSSGHLAISGLLMLLVVLVAAWLHPVVFPPGGDLQEGMRSIATFLLWCIYALGLYGALVGGLGWCPRAYRLHRARGASLPLRLATGPGLAAGFLVLAAAVAYLAAIRLVGVA